jgi:hypothetical protein
MSQKRKISRFRALPGGRGKADPVPPPAVFAQSVEVLLQEALKRVPGLTQFDALAILMRIAAGRSIVLDVRCDEFVDGARLVYLDELEKSTKGGA